MGLKASKLFSECFRASNNPKAVIEAFMYGRGKSNDFLQIYLQSDVQCDRLVFQLLKDDNSWTAEDMKIYEFIMFALFRAEQVGLKPVIMLERLLNAFTLEEVEAALARCIEWHGTGNNPGHVWNGEVGTELLARIQAMKSWDASATNRKNRDTATEAFITETAKGMIAKMPFGNFLKDIPT